MLYFDTDTVYDYKSNTREINVVIALEIDNAKLNQLAIENDIAIDDVITTLKHVVEFTIDNEHLVKSVNRRLIDILNAYVVFYKRVTDTTTLITRNKKAEQIEINTIVVDDETYAIAIRDSKNVLKSSKKHNLLKHNRKLNRINSSNYQIRDSEYTLSALKALLKFCERCKSVENNDSESKLAIEAVKYVKRLMLSMTTIDDVENEQSCYHAIAKNVK